MLKDSTFVEIMTFLDAADAHGKKIPTVIDVAGQNTSEDLNTVSAEARLTKELFLQLHDW
jgi:hypothetical protein